MKKLHFLFLLVGGLMIFGCPLGVGGDEGQEGAGQQELTVTASPSNGGTVTRSPRPDPIRVRIKRDSHGKSRIWL